MRYSKTPKQQVWWDAYDEYLKSPEWAKKRKMRMWFNSEYFAGMCECCGDKPATECHHTNYNNVGHELMFDLACVCSTCHEVLHGKTARDR